MVKLGNWYATALDRHFGLKIIQSFLAVATRINITSCNLQFIKQLLQCSPRWSQQYKVICVGQYINHIATNIAINIKINYIRQYLSDVA